MMFEYIWLFICDHAVLYMMFEYIWIFIRDDAVLDMMFEYIWIFICRESPASERASKRTRSLLMRRTGLQHERQLISSRDTKS